MNKKNSKTIKISEAGARRLSNGNKLQCDICGLTLVVLDNADSCESDSSVKCCDQEMRIY